MKAANFFAGATLLLLTACSPKVTTHITKAYPGVIPADSVHVIELGETIPNTAQMIGRVFVADRRTSTKCEYDQVLRLARLSGISVHLFIIIKVETGLPSPSISNLLDGEVPVIRFPV